MQIASVALSFVLMACSERTTDTERNTRAVELEQLRVLAKQGNAEAQFGMAMIYATGDSISKSNEEALNWMRKAANQGHPIAQYQMGSFYTLDGLAQDYVKAETSQRKPAWEYCMRPVRECGKTS